MFGSKFAKMVPALLLSSAFCSGLAFSQDPDLEKIYKREKGVNRLSSALSSYTYTKKELMNNEKGLTFAVNAYVKDTTDWISGYVDIAAKANDYKTYAEVQSFILKTMQEQGSKRALIRSNYLALSEQLASAIRSLNVSADTDSSEEMRDQQRQIVKGIRDFQARLTRLQAALDNANTLSDKAFAALSTDFLVVKFQKALIDNAIDAHTPQVLAFLDYIRAEQLSAVIKGNLKHFTDPVDLAIYQLQSQKLVQLLPLMDKGCNDAVAAISGTTLSSTEKNRLSAEVRTSCKVLRDSYDQTIKIYTSKVLAKSMHERNLRNLKFKKACNAAASKACENFKALQAITPESVEKSGDPAISYLEQKWDEFRINLEARR